MAEVFGPAVLRRTTWPSASGGTRRSAAPGYHQISPKLRAVLEAYVAGVRRFMAEHPEQVPAWAQEIHPWDAVALGRYIIWGWPLGEAVHDLGAAGVRLTPPAYRGSNEMLIAPGRTAMKAPIAVVDPHLSWYGSVPLLRGPDLRPRRRRSPSRACRSSASRSPASATAGIAPSP